MRLMPLIYDAGSNMRGYHGRAAYRRLGIDHAGNRAS